MSSSPLISDRGLDDVFAWRASGPVSVREFLADANTLAAQLPEGGWQLNLCDDRYHFAVGFVAGLLAGKVSLQPSSQSPETLQRLAADHPGTSWLADKPTELPGLSGTVFPDLTTLSRPAVHTMPQIDDAQTVAILFTSGSTGLPQPHRKTWGKLVLNGRAEAAALGLLQRPLAIVGTLFVIPTAAEIPIVQTMMALGMGTGPAVALLMTLPSISLPSLLMLRKDFDARVLVTVAVLTMLVGIVCGLIGAVLL